MIIVSIVDKLGQKYDLPEVPTLRKAREQVEDLDRAFEEWQSGDDPEPVDENNPLAHYEGCSLTARGTVKGNWEFDEESGDWRLAEEEET